MFMNKLIVLMLIICLLISMVGCGGVPTTPPISSELVLVRVTDPESNLIFVAGKENEDVMVILGEKDTEGNPTSITGAVYVLEQGVSFAIEAGIDGLPIYLIDSEGNKVFFENYTNSTVDVSIYDSSESLIQDTTTINVDPADLLELKQLYDSFYSKQRWSTENTLFALKWGSVGLSVVGCISAGGLTIFSGGALTPVAAFACGKALLSTIAAFTPNDIDNAFSMVIGAGSCLLSGFTVGCDSTALSIIAWAIEEGGGTNHTPIITSTPVTSATKGQAYSYDVNATDSDGDTLTYSLTTSPTGMTIISTTGLINWTPTSSGDYNVTVKVSDGELFDTQSFTITVEENGVYSLCDIGPAGGYIFYDKGYYSSGWRYLEAAPVSTEWTDKEWGSWSSCGCYGTFIGATETGIGTGQSNTTKIVIWLNSHSETDRAAQLCDALFYGGYSDWFLPSRDELILMYTNLKVYGVGGFVDADYWSSSEYDADTALELSFKYGALFDIPKIVTYRVRAARDF